MQINQGTSNPRIPTPKRVKLELEGTNEDGFYKSITGQVQGQPVDVQLVRQANYLDMGGFLIETTPKYAISGAFAGQDLKLEVLPEEQIAEVGGLSVQTGTIYHVAGNIGKRQLRGEIHQEINIENVGGMNFETDRWNVFEGPETKLTAHSDHTVRGQDKGENINALVISERGQLLVQGDLPLSTLAELVVLSPFLNV